MLAALLAVPFLLRAMGTARFGLLLVIAVLIGYYGVFDLGIGRALTHSVARRIGQRDFESIPSLVTTGMAMIGALGIIIAALGMLLSPILAERILKMPAELVPEARRSFFLVATAVPILLAEAGFRGVLEAHRSFGLVSSLRAFGGAWTYLAPLAVLPLTARLDHIVMVQLSGRLLTCLVSAVACARKVEWQTSGLKIDTHHALPLLGFGGWVTVDGLIGPLLVYVDRLFVGFIVGATSVSFYATPGQLLVRLLNLPNAVLSVLFPTFSTDLSAGGQRASALYRRGFDLLLVAMGSAAFVLATFAPEIMRLWLGEEFAERSGPVLRCLSFGLLLSSVNRVPHVLVQGAGRPDLTTKIHLLQLLPYLPLAWWMTARFGILGAAVAWTGRVALDTVMAIVLAHRTVPAVRRHTRSLTALTIASLVPLIAGSLLQPLLLRGIFAGIVLAATALAGWKRLLPAAGR